MHVVKSAAFVRNEIASENYDEANLIYNSYYSTSKIVLRNRTVTQTVTVYPVSLTEPRRGDAAPMAIIELV